MTLEQQLNKYKQLNSILLSALEKVLMSSSALVQFSSNIKRYEQDAAQAAATLKIVKECTDKND